MSELDYIKVNPEITTEFKDLILSQFGDSDNIQKIIEIIASETEDQESLLVSLAEGFKLENAIGAQLDIIGEFVGVERNGADDETYRSKLAVAIAGVTLGVTRDGIAEMAKLLSGGVYPEIYLGRFRDVYVYMEELCFDPTIIGPELGQYFPINTQGQIIVTAGVPFGFDGDDTSAGFGTTGEEDAYNDSGTLSNLVFTSFDPKEFLYKYELNSDVVSIIGLSGTYDKPLINIEDFSHFAIESINPLQDVNYLSARQPGGIADLNTYFSGTGKFLDYTTPARTIYYEVEPTVVQDYAIGVIDHSMILGSVDNGIAGPPEDDILLVSVRLDCETSTPKLVVTVLKRNSDGTQASSTITYTGLPSISGKVIGIYLNPLTREIGYTYDGVDQGLIEADTSDDPEVIVGQPITWSDRRAYSGFFFMQGKRTTVPLENSGDIIAMRWVTDRKEMTSPVIPTGSTDIFGRLI